MKVVKNSNYQIIPFSYQETYEDFKKEICPGSNQKKGSQEEQPKQQVWHEEQLGKSQCEDLYEHVKVFGRQKDHQEEIGKVYTRATGKLNSTTTMYMENGKHKVSFNVKSIKLYIFKTQVALLVLEIDYKGKNIDSDMLVLSNYYMRKLKLSTTTYARRKSKEEEIPVDYVEEILEYLPLNQIQFFSSYINKEKLQRPSIAIMYNYVAIQDERLQKKENGRYEEAWKEVKTMLFYMGRAFKTSYKPNMEVLMQSDTYSYQPFENSIWCVSKEGCSNIIYLTLDEKTDKFFTTNYVGNFENTYLYIYLIVLHQYYAMIYLAKQVSDLPMDMKAYGKETKNYEQLANLRDQVYVFYFKYIFEDISYVSHQQELYGKMREKLYIQDLKKELQFELEKIGDIVESSNQRADELEKERLQEEHRQEQKRREINNKLFVVIGASLTIVSALSAITGILEAYLESQGNMYLIADSMYWDKLLITTIVFLLAIGVASLSYWIYRKKLEKNKK